jgi:4-alpha-glucanotransferase
LVVVNLEDLLGETRPQNLPGTGTEWGNWRRKALGSEAEVQRAIAEATLLFAAMKTEEKNPES